MKGCLAVQIHLSRCCLSLLGEELKLLLLLSRFSHVWLCATPQTAAHQAPPSLGFSRWEHWSGLPFPSPMHESEKGKWSRSVVSDSLRPHGLQPTRFLCPWNDSRERPKILLLFSTDKSNTLINQEHPIFTWVQGSIKERGWGGSGFFAQASWACSFVHP